MKYLLIGFLFGSLSVLVASCERQPQTKDYLEVLGHETLHCFFGQWHSSDPNPNGVRQYPPIDFSSQLIEERTITLRFLPYETVQEKFREFQAASQVRDRAVEAVDGFNARYPGESRCEIYIAIK